jgi:hypothetical protein
MLSGPAVRKISAVGKISLDLELTPDYRIYLGKNIPEAY